MIFPQCQKIANDTRNVSIGSSESERAASNIWVGALIIWEVDNEKPWSQG